MADKVLVGLLSGYLAPYRSYELMTDHNIELIVFTEGSIDWDKRQVLGFLWNGVAWSRQRRPLPQSVYNRLYKSNKEKVITRLESIIGQNKVFNHITRFDKWLLHQSLMNSPLAAYLPETEAYQQDNFLPFLEKHGLVIVKPTLGRLGDRIYRVENAHGEYNIYQNTRYPRATFQTTNELMEGLAKIVDSSFIMQQNIPMSRIDGRIFDLRFLVQKNGKGLWTISGNLSRHALRYAYVTNMIQNLTSVEDALEQSGFGESVSLQSLETISKSVAIVLEKTFGSLGEISVDLGIDEMGNPWIIEVNGKPAKEMWADFEDPQTLQRVYEIPIAYGKYLATK